RWRSEGPWSFDLCPLSPRSSLSGPWSLVLGPWSLVPCPLSLGSSLSPRQGDQEGCPSALVVDGADLDHTIMRLDDPFDDGQAEARPLGLGGVKRLEQLLPLIGGEARAVVPDRDRNSGSAVDRGLGPVDVDLDRVAAGGQGVVEDVEEDLDHPEAV